MTISLAPQTGKTVALTLLLFALAGCSNADNTLKYIAVGGAAGAGLGAGLLAATSGCIPCGAAIGAAVGAGVGGAFDIMENKR